jgi:hypothetical protein
MQFTQNKQAAVFLNFIKANKITALKGLSWNKQSKVFQQTSNGYTQYYSVYLADVMNQDQQDYVITNVMQGSGNYSSVNSIYNAKTGKAVSPSFAEVAAKSLGQKGAVHPCVNWYCYLAKPFITEKKGSVILNFENTPNATTKTCSYQWNNGSLKLLNQNSDCLK